MKLLSSNGSNLQFRVCVFASFSKDGHIPHTVRWYLNQLASLNISVLFISTAPHLDQESIDAVKSYCHSIYIRDNVGYDFQSFREGLKLLIDEPVELIILANDSVFGPFQPLSPLIEFGLAKNLDIWSATDSHEVAYHLQSYFMVIRGEVSKTKDFLRVWQMDEENLQAMATLPQKQQRYYAIENFEVGYSQEYLRSGFKIGAMFQYEHVAQLATKLYLDNLSQKQTKLGTKHSTLLLGPNPTQYLWHTLVAHMNFPFLKRNLVEMNPLRLKHQHDWLDCLDSSSEATLAFVKDLFARNLQHLLYRFTPKPDESPNFFCTAQLHQNLIHLNLLTETIPAQFDEEAYARENPDILSALISKSVESPWHHYRIHGFNEKRSFPIKPIENQQR